MTSIYHKLNHNALNYVPPKSSGGNTEWKNNYNEAKLRYKFRMDDKDFNRIMNGNVSPKTNKLSKIAKNHSRRRSRR